MRITSQRGPAHLELMAEGLLDNESSRYLRTTVEEAVREGHDRIVLNMEHVSYLSSAGISVLLECRKQLSSVQGYFGICGVAPPVKRVLEQTRVYAILAWDREAATGEATPPLTTAPAVKRISEPGLELEIYELGGGPLTCRTIGDPGRVFEGAFRPEECRTVSFSRSMFGLGLGAFGGGFEECRPRFGDFVAVAGGVAQSPTSGLGAADYLQASGNFVPDVQMLYGLTCEGSFSQLVRFRADAARPVGLSRITELCLSQCGYDQAGMVMLSECVGIVGAVLRRSPALDEVSSAGRFDFPQIRDWLSFSAEQVYRRSLALAVGVVRRGTSRAEADDLAPLLRPLDATGRLAGHFHAAAFPYRPLKKGLSDLNETVAALFDSGTLQGVLHLLNDMRPISGAGETELLEGACWIAPIKSVSGDARRIG